ncbi:MAG: hypothetical protein ACRD0W_09600 [Acidimicrobiales bacterium]
MTELTIRDEAAALLPVPSSAAQALVEWAQAAQAAHDIAAPLSGTDFVPSHFKGNPAAATAAVLAGAEVGLSPMQALQSIYVVSGKPAMYAQTLRALCQAKGHEVWVEDQTETRVIVCGRRRGSQQVEKAVWSYDRAKKAGYTRNAKYQTDPIGMLTARATADVCRRIAADALAGLAYSVEELYDEPAAMNGPDAPARRTARRAPPSTKSTELAADQAELEPELEPEPSEPITEGGITSHQIKKMGALMREQDLSDRDDALAYVAKVIGRQVGSRNELTKAEASAVIDALEADAVSLVEPEPLPDAFPDEAKP